MSTCMMYTSSSCMYTCSVSIPEYYYLNVPEHMIVSCASVYTHDGIVDYKSVTIYHI